MRDYLVPANSHIKSPRPRTTEPDMSDTNPDAPTNSAEPSSMLALTAKIVAAYLGKNSTPAAELPKLIDRVFQGLAGLTTARPPPRRRVRIRRCR